MQFYWVRDRVIQGKILVYWMTGEQNLAEYFTKHHPTIPNWLKQSTFLVPIVEASKYACYISPNDLRWCVESLPA